MLRARDTRKPSPNRWRLGTEILAQSVLVCQHTLAPARACNADTNALGPPEEQAACKTLLRHFASPMEPTTAKSTATKPAINATSILACLPEPVLELVLAAAGPRARVRSARAARAACATPRCCQKNTGARPTSSAGGTVRLAACRARAFADRVKGERACCDLLVALAESGNQLTWRQKHDCIERAGDGACELLARIAATTNVYSEPHTPTAERSEPHTPVAGARLRPPPSPASTAAWVAVVSPRAAQTLRACGQAGVVGNHARDLLTRAQTARLRKGWRPAPSLEEASARVASAFRVFYDGEGVVKALEALAARVRAKATDDQLALIRATEAVLFDESADLGESTPTSTTPRRTPFSTRC